MSGNTREVKKRQRHGEDVSRRKGQTLEKRTLYGFMAVTSFVLVGFSSSTPSSYCIPRLGFVDTNYSNRELPPTILQQNFAPV